MCARLSLSHWHGAHYAAAARKKKSRLNQAPQWRLCAVRRTAADGVSTGGGVSAAAAPLASEEEPAAARAPLAACLPDVCALRGIVQLVRDASCVARASE